MANKVLYSEFWDLGKLNWLNGPANHTTGHIVKLFIELSVYQLSDFYDTLFIIYIYIYIYIYTYISSVQFSCSVVPDSLWPHELQHARPPCLSPTPGVYLNSYPLNQWCHLTISSSVIPFSSCLQYFPTSVPFQRVRSLHHVAKILEFQLQHQSFQWTSRTDFL